MSPSSLTNAFPSIPRPSLRRISSKLSFRTRKSSTGSVKSSFSYQPYAVYHISTTMLPTVLRDPDTTRKLFEIILESPNGRKSLSRLARTCKALKEPALNCLWRELDSLLPLLALFPGHLLKRAKKPGMGFVKTPSAEDWSQVLIYGERVRRITYDEGSFNVATSVFNILQDTRPQTYVLPNLLQLVWRTETPAGLDRCAMFLHPELQSLTVEVGTRYPNLDAFLADVSARTRLTTFAFTSHTQLPDAFVTLLSRQTALEKLMLSAPGALSSEVGRWVASLKHLKSLQLELFSRTKTAVEGFWDEISATSSGASTPNSEHSIDSGVFSASDLNERVKVDKSWAPAKHAFSTLRQLHLTGNATNIAAWLSHLNCPLADLTIAMEDPPEARDWQALCRDLSRRFGQHLQGLRVIATGSSRFAELVRSTSRGAEIELRRLTLEHLKNLSKLVRLEIELPESSAFVREDIIAIARACPRVETLKLCPTARFNGLGPRLTLEDLAPLMMHCRYLNTLHVVVNAKRATQSHILFSRHVVSNSLQWMHVGHSWISEPLQVAILLSHFAPRLEQIKFYEKNRAVEANARGWKEASDFLPHLQAVRWMEKYSFVQSMPIPPSKSEKSVDATPTMVSREADATVQVAECSVEAIPELISAMVDATPETHEMEVSAMPVYSEQSIEAMPEPEPAPESPRPSVSKLVDTSVFYRPRASILTYPLASILPIVLHLLTFMRKMFISYPLYVPLHLIDLIMTQFHSTTHKHKRAPQQPEASSSSSTTDEDHGDVELDSITMETVTIAH